ncbi:hypothetical protein FRB94_013119 [Tulasnella sp. JGI-2019a]|nr:hypothetical protein FRB94_013119 [Tulasnella sp. JGI-2019a]
MLARVASLIFGRNEPTLQQSDKESKDKLETEATSKATGADEPSSSPPINHGSFVTSSSPTTAHSKKDAPISSDISASTPFGVPSLESSTQRHNDIVAALLSLGDVHDIATLTTENDPYGATPEWSSPIIHVDPPRKAKTITAPKLKLPKAQKPSKQLEQLEQWNILLQVSDNLFHRKTGIVSYQCRKERPPIGRMSALLIHRPDGLTRMYTTKDRMGTKSVLGQMAIDSGALDFMASGDDTVRLQQVSVEDFVPGEIPDSKISLPVGSLLPPVASPWVPDIIETMTGYIHTNLLTALSNPPLHGSHSGTQIEHWCQEENKIKYGMLEARWLVTMRDKARHTGYGATLVVRRLSPLKTKVWSVGETCGTQDLALDAVSALAISEGVESFLRQRSEHPHPNGVIPPLAAVSHDRFMATPLLRAKGSKYFHYNEYKKQIPLSTGGSPPRKEIIEFLEAMVYDVVAAGIDIAISYTTLRDDKHTGYGCLLRLEAAIPSTKPRSRSVSSPSTSKSYSWLADAIFVKVDDAKKAVCLQAICLGELREFISSVIPKNPDVIPKSFSSAVAAAGVLITVTEKMEQDFLEVWNALQKALLKDSTPQPVFQYHGNEGWRGADMIVAFPDGSTKKYTVPLAYANTRSARVGVVLKAAAMGAVATIESYKSNPAAQLKRARKAATKAARLNAKEKAAASGKTIIKAQSKGKGKGKEKTAAVIAPLPAAVAPFPLLKDEQEGTPQDLANWFPQVTGHAGPVASSSRPPALRGHLPPIIISPSPNEMFTIDDRRRLPSAGSSYDVPRKPVRHTQSAFGSGLGSNAGLSVKREQREDGELSDTDASQHAEYDVRPSLEAGIVKLEPQDWLHDLPQVRYGPKRHGYPDSGDSLGGESYPQAGSSKRARYM